MPPVAALVISFGSLPMSDAQTNAMSVFDHHLGDYLTQTGLFSISAIEPEHGFLLFLHNVLGIVDVNTFVYSYTHFAAAVGGTRPTPERFLDFFEMHGTEFKIVDAISGDNVGRAKDRIVARIMRLLDLCIQSIPSGSIEDGGDEEPISFTTKDTLEKVYPKKYGQEIQPSELPSPVVLGKMYRAVMSGSFSLIKITSIVPQNAFSLSAKDDELIMTSSGGFKRKRENSKIQNLEKFYQLMEVMMQGYVFVSVGAPAPYPEWGGRPDYGKVAGTRLQFSRAGKEAYLRWIRSLGNRLGEPGLGLLMSIEMDCRAQWVDAFHSGIQLESVVRQSIIDKQGSADQKITAFKGRRVGPGNPPGGSKPEGLKPGGPKDYSKLPNFDPDLKTGAKYKGKLICKMWNDGRKCKFGQSCKFEHRCDVVINDRGDMCGSDKHTRYNHKEATAAQGQPQAEEDGE